MNRWLLSQSGRRVSKVLAFTGIYGGFLVYYLPNTTFIDRYKSITHLYRNGLPVKLSDKILPLVKEAMNDLGMSEEKQKLISIYNSFSFDLFRAGSTVLSHKGILGIPDNFKYADVREFNTTGMLVNNDHVEWSSPEGISLLESLVFSDDAKKFAIAKELVHLNTYEPFMNGLFTASVLFMCYTVSSKFNSTLNLYARPRRLRLVLYGLVSTFTYVMWIVVKDISCVSSESSADESVANISERYAKGGLEYYEKILKRNIALRSLMGTKGEDLYTAYGNDQVLLRTKHMPFTARRDYMKDKIQEYYKVEEGATNDSKHNPSVEVTKENSLSSEATKNSLTSGS